MASKRSGCSNAAVTGGLSDKAGVRELGRMIYQRDREGCEELKKLGQELSGSNPVRKCVLSATITLTQGTTQCVLSMIILCCLSALIKAIMAIGAGGVLLLYFLLNKSDRTIQEKAYCQAVLNLLREKLVKKKEEIKNRKE